MDSILQQHISSVDHEWYICMEVIRTKFCLQDLVQSCLFMLVHSPSIANMNTFWNRPWYNLFLPNGTATSSVPRASPTRLTMGYHQTKQEWQQAWLIPKASPTRLAVFLGGMDLVALPGLLHCVPRWNRSYWAHSIVQNPKRMNSLEEWTHGTLQLQLLSELQKTIRIFNSMELKSTHCSTQTQLIIHCKFQLICSLTPTMAKHFVGITANERLWKTANERDGVWELT